MRGMGKLPSLFDLEAASREEMDNEEQDIQKIEQKKKFPAPNDNVTIAQKDLIQFDKDWESAVDYINGNAITFEGFKTITFEIESQMKTTCDDLAKQVTSLSRKVFDMEAVETSQGDLDAEEEEEVLAMEEAAVGDEEANEGEDQVEEEGEEEEEEEEEEVEEEETGEEEDVALSSKRILGETAQYCPVTFMTKRVRLQGDPELAVKYNGYVYYLADEAAQQQFLADPKSVIEAIRDPRFHQPKPRYLILGGIGSGKSLHGRQILKNTLWTKLGKNIGPLHADEILSPLLSLPRLPTEAELEANEQLLDSFAQETGEANKEKTDGEEEESDKANLSDEEAAIRSYLTEGEPLPEDILESLIGKFWTTEPYLSRGVIIEGFPASTEQSEGRGCSCPRASETNAQVAKAHDEGEAEPQSEAGTCTKTIENQENAEKETT
ncbi:adenylate kinase [Cichlidogyrus casuarinus]|uniref:Adenylate kinase n=1 Tax=Cichlidogyrus casuarinus TaxID=1844966 RepID=A0ABD2QG96_9PLAT